ncbi:RNA polymerase sigma factor [Arenimonas terrae]|jgi:RNA polymerase sigma factor (sigma-70 family)|uniref:RNA polymerase sigma factor n=1 Tax=Arenimonas terrae TaxID=2546226 RepID=A0A5C4RVY0_9GAMM|nr:sigma-70 family RNA polymerase sigma factor [Arenimonas terrae]TNJ35062.1 sigma-70 family RNA polymerase sigma factor [Arenimonas terrae]
MNTQVLETLVHTHLPAAARGDRDAYGRIVAGCQSTVTSIALAIVRDVPASEDIAQEAFLSAWQNLRRLNNPASFLPWLRQITRNLARDHLRAQHHRANPGGDIEALIASVADPQPGPSEHLAEAQDHAIAAAVIDSLPEESREVLLLYYREGQSSRQVAGLLGLQDAAVRKRLSRARERVREELLQRLGEFAKSTAPGAGFTAAVAAMLMVGAPPAAAATAFGAGALGAAHGATKIGMGALGGAFAGIAGGLWGIWFGVRHLLRDPFDRREKRQVIAYAVFTSLITIGFSLGIVALAKVPGWIPHLALSVGFMLAITWACGVWLPRIVARRTAREIATDPAAAERHARARRRGRLIAAGAMALATAGLVLGLWASGRIG